MDTATPQLVISRVFDAPRELVYRAFTDPDHLAAWWGPIGNSLPRHARRRWRTGRPDVARAPDLVTRNFNPTAGGQRDRRRGGRAVLSRTTSWAGSTS
jgi:hypothetical protein